MRKIISILVALGLVLSLSAIATPVAADVTEPTVVLSDYCACHDSSYNITFNITASLTQGVGCVCIKFPADTTVPATYETGDIVINGEDVHAEEITVIGREVCFIPPADVDDPGPVWVFFSLLADLENPCTPGPYQLEVKTCRLPDATYVKSETYTIIPEIATYTFEVDFGPTYPGIAKDFVPPFKMCGQNDTAQNASITCEFFDTVWNVSIPGWLTVFNVSLKTLLTGCNTPCHNVTIWAELVKCPEDEEITLGFNGTWFELTSANLTGIVCERDAKDFVLHDELVLGSPATIPWSVTWNASLHFSSPGKYEICIAAECPEIAGCDPAETDIIAKECYKFNVYQWKEAMKICLYRKWNLISLPLVPLVDPPISTADKTGIMDAYAHLDEVLGIWHYDRGAPTCNGDWLLWANNPATDTLTDMEDGKSYWVRIAYNSTHGPGTLRDGLWVFGTLKPVPTAAPSAYPVCDGWNMMGFTSMIQMADGAYLWNFPLGAGGYGAVYGWNAWGWGGMPAQSWVLMTNNWMLFPGGGFWASFDGPGTIFPP